MISKQASQFVLTIADIEPVWARGSAISPSVAKAISSSHAYFNQGSSFSPVLQNTVAVFRNSEIAGNTFDQEKPPNVSLEYPAIGSECFFNNTVPINKLLVFRKNNVVVWVWLQQDKTGDIERYARIVEQKIDVALNASIPSPLPSKPVSTQPMPPPPQPSPAVSQPVTPFNSDTVVNRQAYQMVLSLADMSTGWTASSTSTQAKPKASSTCNVRYSQGTSFAASLQNTVAVYRTIDLARTAYELEKPAGGTVTNPPIGDECFLNDSLALDKRMVFRQNNVLVWLWVQQFPDSDLSSYARIIEQKIKF